MNNKIKLDFLASFQDFWAEKEPESNITKNDDNNTLLVRRPLYPTTIHLYTDHKFEVAVGNGILNTSIIYQNYINEERYLQNLYDNKQEIFECLYRYVLMQTQTSVGITDQLNKQFDI